jgi:hypothetical protein
MRDYHLHELSEDRFESLILAIASRVLGIGVTSFSKGPDGGRDGRFIGKANAYPSAADPWSGKWIIQSKHTDNSLATCSDRPFSAKFAGEEIPRIKALHGNGELDIYLLATNRKKSGNADFNIRSLIHGVLGHDKIGIIGVEDLTRHLDENQSIVDLFNLNRNRGPLRFVPNDMVALIDAFSTEVPDYLKFSRLGDELDLTKFDEKNLLNNVSDELADSIEDDSMPYFDQIEEFLNKPKNDRYRLKYYALSNEIKQKLIAENATHLGFSVALSELYDAVVGRHPELSDKRRLITVFLHYMYWTCDIGRKRDRRRKTS